MRTLLIDSDILAYEFAAKSERKYEWDAGEITRVADEIEGVKERMATSLAILKRELKADDFIICLSDPDANFRKAVLPTYKANRAGVVKPEHLMPLKAWLGETYRSYVRPTLEADDIMGILATHPTLVKGEKVIVSIDKDMGQVPGKWFVPGKGMRTVTPADGVLLHFLQMLTGDPVDGYRGCPGIGPKKAGALLADESPTIWWERVVSAYAEKGLDEDEALAQARVAKILQWTDYDYKAKAPILWNPPT